MFLRTLLLVAVLCPSWTANALPYSDDYVSQLAMSFRAYGDREALNIIVAMADAEKSAALGGVYPGETDLRRPLDAKESYTSQKLMLDAFIPGSGSAVESVANRLEELGGSIDARFSAIKWGAELTNDELKAVVRGTLEAAEKNGSLTTIIDGLSARWGRSIGAGDFPLAIRTMYESEQARNNTTKLLRIADEILEHARRGEDNSSAASKGAEKSLAASKEVIDRLNAAEKNAEKLIAAVRKPDEQSTREKAWEQYRQNQRPIDNQQLTLNILNNLGRMLGVKNMDRSVALTQLYISSASAANKYAYANSLPAKDRAQMPNPQVVFANDWMSAAFMAFQAMKGSESAEKTITATLQRIVMQLEVLTGQLDFLIRSTESNFQHVFLLLGQQSFVLEKILGNTDDIIRKQYRDEAIAFDGASSKQIAEIQRRSGFCKGRDLRFCQEDVFYKDLLAIVTDTSSMAYATKFERTANLPSLLMSLSDNPTLRFRIFNSSIYMAEVAKSALRSRPTVGAKQERAYAGSLKLLEFDLSHLNHGLVWKAAVDAVSHEKSLLNDPPKILIDELKAQGRLQKAYFERFGNYGNFHEIMNLELILAARDIDAAYRGILSGIVDLYIGRVLERTQDRVTGWMGQQARIVHRVHRQSPKLHESEQDVRPVGFSKDADSASAHGAGENASVQARLRPILYQRGDTEAFRWFVVLEKLGLGEIQKTVSVFQGGGGVRAALRYKFKWRAPAFARSLGLLDEKSEIDSFLTLEALIGPGYNLSGLSGLILKGFPISLSQSASQVEPFFSNLQVHARADDRYLNSLKKAMSLAVSSAIASEFSAIERMRFQPPPVADAAKDPILRAHLAGIERARRMFEEYRLRFYLYQAFIQQALYDERTTKACREQYSTPGGSDSHLPATVHPQEIAERMTRGYFYDVAIHTFVFATTRNENKRVTCRFSGLPRFLSEGMTKLEQMN